MEVNLTTCRSTCQDSFPARDENETRRQEVTGFKLDFIRPIEVDGKGQGLLYCRRLSERHLSRRFSWSASRLRGLPALVSKMA